MSDKSYRLFRIVFVGLILLTIIVLASVITEFRAVNVRKKLDHALHLERSIGNLLSLIQDAETGQRGYLLTGEPSYLKPQLQATDAIDRILAEINEAVAGDSLQTARAENVTALTRRKFQDIAATIKYYRQGNTDALTERFQTQRGRSIMDSIRLDVQLLRSIETRDVELRQRQLDSLSTVTTFLRLMGVIGLATVFYYIYSQLRPLVSTISGWNEAMAAEIVERRRIEQVNNELIASLNNKNRELDQFAYIASHDLNEPLRTVSNYVEVLNEDYGGQLDSKARELLDTIQRATVRMRDLIETLLHFSRIGRSEAAARVDLGCIVNEARENLELRIEESAATISVEPLPDVTGYAVELRQLFQNLLANALKFHRPGHPPRIEVFGRATAECVQVSVRDQGIGMSEEDQQKIFDLFTRLNSRDSYEGQGIGLAFCQKIVQLHQGTITVDSQPGRGSTFTVTIPRSLDYEQVRVRPSN